MINEEITENEISDWENQDNEGAEQEIGSVSNVNFDSVRVVKSNQDYNIDYLITSINKNIDLGPDYQRRSRWSTTKQSILIESFLLNIPVPPIFLYEKEFYEYEVIDGRQRLEAIKAFVNNEFRLKGLEYLKHLIGKKFNDLEENVKKSLYRRTISATILLVESKTFDKYDLRMILFNRLNTGGEKLNGQELRNAIYASKFNDLVMELSSTSEFRQLWGIPIPENQEDEPTLKKLKNNPLYKTMMDCELVLRFFAVRNVYEGIITTGTMKDLLDGTMKQNLKLSDEELITKKDLFLDSLHKLCNRYTLELILNHELTNPKKARNLYDSMFVALSLCEESQLLEKHEVIANLKTVLTDPTEYEKIISKGNSIENIQYRVNKSIEILTNSFPNA